MRPRPTSPGQGGRFGWPVALLLAVAAGLAGCAAGGRDAGRESVTLRDLDVETETPTNRAGQRPEMAQPRGLVFMRRMVLPLERSLESAWAMADPAPVPPLSRAVWRSNGVRLGVLSTEAWESFAGSLPRVFQARQTGLMAADEPVAIVTSPRLVRPIRIDLTIPPLAPRETWAQRGRLRLLAEIGRATASGGDDDEITPRRLVLTPHHAVPRSLVLPEALADARRPGVAFSQLALRFQLQPGELLVMGLDRPWDRVPPPKPEPQTPPARPESPEGSPVAAASPAPVIEADAAEADAAAPSGSPESAPDPAEPPAPDEPERVPQVGPPMPEVPPHLGRALFTAQHAGRPVQYLMVLSVVPLGPDDPPPDAASEPPGDATP